MSDTPASIRQKRNHFFQYSLLIISIRVLDNNPKNWIHMLIPIGNEIVDYSANDYSYIVLYFQTGGRGTLWTNGG